MNKSSFICIEICDASNVATKQYFNIEHIVRVYQQNDNIYIETSDYCSYKTTYKHLDAFMDRFIAPAETSLLKG